MEQGYERVLTEQIAEAMVTIKAYCETRKDCEECCLYRDEYCFFALCDVPCDWEIEGHEH
jgi:hypothetical protein